MSPSSWWRLQISNDNACEGKYSLYGLLESPQTEKLSTSRVATDSARTPSKAIFPHPSLASGHLLMLYRSRFRSLFFSLGRGNPGFPLPKWAFVHFVCEKGSWQLTPSSLGVCEKKEGNFRKRPAQGTAFCSYDLRWRNIRLSGPRTSEIENVDNLELMLVRHGGQQFCWDNWEWFAQTLVQVQHFLSTSRCVPLLVGCCANEGLLRMCKHQRGSLLASRAATRAQAYRSRHWEHQCRPFGEAEGCTFAVLPLLAPNVPHVVWNTNQWRYSDCTIVGFGKSFPDVHRSRFLCSSHLGEAILDPPLPNLRLFI